jgi:hypothetical protein
MARIRCIKPEFWVSEQVAECSIGARLTFIGLWNFCDDGGVHPAKPKTLKAELFPMDTVSPSDLAKWVDELIGAGLVTKFDSDGVSYWHVTGWSRHQKIDRPSAKHPLPPANDSANTRRAIEVVPANDARTLDDDSANARRAPPPGRDRSGEEGSGEESASPKSRRRTRALVTTLAQDFGISDRVKAWAHEHGFSRLEEHLEHFKLQAAAKGYSYADWDAGFMKSIREDWASLRRSGTPAAHIGHAAPRERDLSPPWLAGTGFTDLFAAENAGCGPGNAAKFRNGAKVDA